jgi:hypothetical protein
VVAADAAAGRPAAAQVAGLPADPPVPPGHPDRRPVGPRIWLGATVVLTLGAFAAAVALAPAASAPPGRGLAWVLFVGSSVHVASTGWLYTLPEVRGYARQRPARLILLPVALILASAAAAAVVSPATLAWALLPYYAWQFFHFQKQNLGLAALAASSRRVASLRPAERRAIMIAGYAGIAGLIAHPGLLQLRISPPGLTWLYPAAATVFAGAVGAGLVVAARRPGADGAFWPYVVYLISLGFFLPVFAFRSPYAAVGGMTIAHGLQYLLLLGLVAAAATGRLAFGAYLGAVMAHFVIDASLWRLRDPFPRAFLAARVPGLLPGRSPAADGSPADIR